MRHWRTKSGLTLAALAEKAGVDPGFLAYIETGKKAPSLQTLAKIAGALGLPMAELFQQSKPIPDEPRARLSRHVKMLTRGSSRSEINDLLEVLKLLRRPGIAKAIRTIAQK